MRSTKAGRLLLGVGALLVSVAMLLGIPIALILLGGSPIPDSLPSVQDALGALTSRDSGQMLTTALTWAGWAGWIIFAVAFVREAKACASGTVQDAVAAVGPRGLARSLIAAVALLALPLSVTAMATADPPQAVGHFAPLLVPAGIDQSVAGTKDPAPDRYVVDAGDSLWGIAEEQWNDGDRYPEIYQASRSVRQAGGQRISDPDHIEPGWTLMVPSDPKTHNAKPKLPVAPLEQQPGQTPSLADEEQPPDKVSQNLTPSPSAAGQTIPRPVQGTANLPQLEPVEAELPAQAVRSAAGFGAILAAGLAAGLAGLRLRERRRRRPSEPIRIKEPEPVEIVDEIAAMADPMSVKRVDSALRRLAADCRSSSVKLPTIRLARLYEYQFDLHLAQPQQLPAPWLGNAEETVWSLDQSQDPPGDEDWSEVPAPYPALITLGHDLTLGRPCHILVDLDYVAGLGLFGETAFVQEILNALALDLATSAWADDLQISAVNWLADLDPALRTGRVNFQLAPQPYLAKLLARVGRESAKLQDMGLALSEARAATMVEYWTPEVVLVPDALNEQDRDQLGAAIAAAPRVSVCAITVQDSIGQWYLEQDPQHPELVTLQPLGLRLEPQRVSDEDYEEILRAFQDAHGLATPQSGQVQATREPALTDVLSAAALTPVADRPDGDLDLTVAPASVDPAAGSVPEILILGAPEVSGVTGPIEPGKRERCLELAAFLALNPQATPAQFNAAIWPGIGDQTSRAMRSGLMSRARRWFGSQPNGEFWFDYDHADVCRINAAVRTDWDVFGELVSSGAHAASDRDLRLAMQLVRGRPFDVSSNRYGWAAGHLHLMTPQLTDAAFELSTRLLLQCDFTGAVAIAERGLIVDPWCEPLHRNRLKALAALDLASAQSASRGLLIELERFSLEPEAETLALIGEIEGVGIQDVDIQSADLDSAGEVGPHQLHETEAEALRVVL